MKKIIIYITIFLFGASVEAFAERAYPFPIQVTQPDGTTLTIQVHGDEFLSWTTCAGALVSKGPDGFYYRASFSADGSIVRSSSKVSSSPSAMSFSGAPVTPPMAAVMKASALRASSGLPQRSSISTGTGNHFLVVLIEFTDLEFSVSSPVNAFNALLNETGYSANGGTGSVKDYFYDNSGGEFDPVFDVYGPVKVSHGYYYYSEYNYGRSTTNPGARELIVEACNKLDTETDIDFSDYDIDGSGIIDNVFFFYAGYGAASGASDRIWPHKWSVSGLGTTYTYDGKTLKNYACGPELRGSSGTNMTGIGTFCHEFGHVLGLPDFYDTNYETEGEGNGLQAYDVMDQGNYNNNGNTPPYMHSEERIMLGWMDAGRTELTAAGDYSLDPVSENKAYFTPTSNEGEYFVYESRQNEGWDRALPAFGLTIYHVDKSGNMVNGKTAAERWEYWEINDYAAHQCFDMVEAVPSESDADYYSTNHVFPGGVNNTSFTATSSPAALTWAGVPSGFYLTDISNTSGVSFTLSITGTLSGRIINKDGEPVSGATVTISIPVPSSLSSEADGMMDETISLAGGVPTKFISDSKGEFLYESVEAGKNYLISVSAEGYLPYSNVFTMIRGTNRYDITLATPSAITEGFSITKSGPYYGSGLGLSSAPCTFYAYFSYTSDEVETLDLAGGEITSISFCLRGTGATSVEAFVMYDGGDYSWDVPIASVNFGSVTTVDISSSHIVIPSGKEIKIGYGVVDSDIKSPMGVDIGPGVSGGLYYSSDKTSWRQYSTRNLFASATIEFPSYIFMAYGYNTIASDAATYSAGDSFTFSLDIVGTTPTSTAWTYDGADQADGSTISLTAGTHTVKATLTYSDSHTEVIVKKIVVL